MSPVPEPTARLFFREWRSDDWPLAFALWGDARVTAFIGGQFTEAQVRQRLQEQMDLQRQHGFQYWPVFQRDSGEHIGCCGLRPRDLPQGILEIGFHLRPQSWGKGYATEAAQAVSSYAFEKLGARALFAGHHPQNASSRRTLEKLGFQYSHDEPYAPTGLRHPSYFLRRDEITED